MRRIRCRSACAGVGKVGLGCGLTTGTGDPRLAAGDVRCRRPFNRIIGTSGGSSTRPVRMKTPLAASRTELRPRFREATSGAFRHLSVAALNDLLEQQRRVVTAEAEAVAHRVG